MKHKRSLLVHLTIAFSILMSFQARAQRPKVGLVLSGGGAKGVAHIGVLKALEEAGIVPDYITGTSMGSLIGGLYAIGYSADQLDSIVHHIDWDVLLTNQVPLNEIAIEEKNYYDRFIIELPLNGIRVGLPKGMIEGQKLSELLSKLTRSAHGINDFSNFPIPFACVAADIEAGKPVLLNKGSLPRAMRASMAISSVFTPVIIDGKLLVDGGLLRNFPVQEIIEMGADIVIGVNVGGGLYPREELNNMVTVLAQSAFIIGVENTERQKEFVDIYIEPDIEGFSSGSFSETDEIFIRGMETGARYLPVFKKLADSLNRFGPPSIPKKLVRKDSFLINEVTILGNEKITDKLIKGKLRIEEGKQMSLGQVEDRISLLYGTRYFEKVTYQLVNRGDMDELIVRVLEEPDGRLKLMAHYSTENDVGIWANITYRNLLLKSSRVILDLDMAINPYLGLNYLKYLGGKQNSAIVAGFALGKHRLPLYDQGEKDAEFDMGLINMFIKWQATSFKNTTFGVSLSDDITRLHPVIADSSLRVYDRIRNKTVNAAVFVERNTLNNQYFPTRGLWLRLKYKEAFGIKNNIKLSIDDPDISNPIEIDNKLDGFRAFEAMVNYNIPVGKKVTLKVNSSLMLSSLGELNITHFNYTDYYAIGGFRRPYGNSVEFLGAYQREYYSQNAFYLAGGIQYEPFKKVFITGMFNYVDVEYPARWFKSFDFEDLDGLNRRYGYTFSVAYNSFIGPVSLSMARDLDRSLWLWNLNVGYYFY